MNQLDLRDRVAIVTGGARGIGYAVAERILRSGGRVSLWDRDRARLELEAARRESAAEIARAARELAAALTRARRDSAMLDAADRVAARSLVAFAEGASGLASVIEAQRSARDARGQYLDDLAAANTAVATARLAGMTAVSP